MHDEGNVDDFIAAIKRLSDEELQDLRTTPEWAYFTHRLFKLRPGDELTLERIEADARVCSAYPASVEYYAAQGELSRRRARFLSQKRVITVGPVMTSDLVP